MAKINGTDFLVYADGVVIAAQKNCTVSWEQDLPDATTKDGAGWAEHILGSRSVTCDFDGLMSTTGLSADGLVAYIRNRKTVVLAINGMGTPIVGEACLKSVSINAPQEDAASISGSFTFTGGAWLLTGDNANLMTDPDGNGHTYGTFTVSGIAVSSAIATYGGGVTNYSALSNNMSITSGATYKVITYMTLNSGTAPSIRLDDGSAKSNTVQLSAGPNVATLVATGTGTYQLNIFVTSASTNYSLTNIYVFKV